MGEYWMIGAKNSYESRRLIDEFTKRGIKFVQYNWDELVLPLEKIPKFCLLRYSRGMMEKLSIVYVLSILEELDRKGVMLSPSLSGIYREDKVSMYLLWREYLANDIKMPDTIITKNIKEGKKFLDKKGSILFKPIIGGLGKNIIKISNEEHLEEIYNKFQVLYLQEYIENQGYDIRTIIVGDDIIAKYVRYNPNDFRHNIHSGGVGKRFEEISEMDPNIWKYDKIIDKIIIKLNKITSLDLVGIDLLPSNSGDLYLLEWNSTFGFAGAESTLGINIAEKIVKHLILKIKEQNI
ncbi:MAG: ATP-grasp domain-containing protein [Candidatus Helarchaeota archaeon]